MQRLVATIVGAVVGALLSGTLAFNAWTLALGVLIAMVVCFWVHLDAGAKVAGYICGIVLFEHSGHAWSYAFFRLLETALGIGVALLISFVPKLLAGETKPTH